MMKEAIGKVVRLMAGGSVGVVTGWKPVLRAVLLVFCATTAMANEVDPAVRGVLKERCAKCHSGAKAKGEIDVAAFDDVDKLLAQPNQLQRMIEALDANDMPPEDEPPLDPAVRRQLVVSLKSLLRQAAARESKTLPIRRLNRFQYNYSVKDLFRLQRDVFDLPEKLIVRRDRYIPLKTGKMPETVQVASQMLQPQPVLREVKAFPKDLRAEHGYDNQANQLTLSPLLLDAFLRLSVSIVESPDFDAQTVGIWNEFFAPPAADVDMSAETARRLKSFLRRAFRGSVDDATVRRYADYAAAKRSQGLSFTDAMKKVAAAVLCSPRFLYRADGTSGEDAAFAMASRLSFFLWSSGPDDELLDAAERGVLADSVERAKVVDRMLDDPKIERFLDSFPTQWLQLENALAVTPDPKISRYFRVDENQPASVAMVVEPLLLFDAVFLENRPIVELIAPDFSYRSDFLRDWYESPLVPTSFDEAAVVTENERRETRRKSLEATIAETTKQIDGLANPVRERLLAAKRAEAGNAEIVDLKPLAAWEFDGDLRDSIGGMHLQSHGELRFEVGHVVLEKAYLQSPPIGRELRAKTIEVWLQLSNLDQPGGGAMTIQGAGDFFDSIVIGERKPRHWISGSNGFARTDDFGESTPEVDVDRPIHLTMVYGDNGVTTLYRNGIPYGKPFRKGPVASFPGESTSVLFGTRHLPATGNRFLNVRIDKARLYDRALKPEEVQASASRTGSFLAEAELVAAMTEDIRTEYQAATSRLEAARKELAQVPPSQDVGQLRQAHQRRFEEQLRAKLRSPVFQRVTMEDSRYGGVITNAAVLSMTSGPLRTQPIARGSWIIEVIFNDPPPPPPNDVPPLREDDDRHLTIRERFAAHRENPSCAGCHARIDPLGFALENFDITGRWRDRYDNGKPVDASGRLVKQHDFAGPAQFKQAIVKEESRFARALTSHLFRYAAARELSASDQVAIDAILEKTSADRHRLRSLIREIALSR